jgi:hypothetical protein
MGWFHTYENNTMNQLKTLKGGEEGWEKVMERIPSKYIICTYGNITMKPLFPINKC